LLGLGTQLASFKLLEETGDLVPHGSFLQLCDGTRVTFSWHDIEEAITRICQKTAGWLLQDGFVMSGCVVKGFKERWGSEEKTTPDDPVCLLLEKQDKELAECSNEELANCLESYAFDLPTDFDRSFLNALPRPSPSWNVLEELIRREAWEPLTECLGSVASLCPGIAIQWTAEVVKRSGGISDPKVRADVESAKPDDPQKVRIWAERLLDLWFGSEEESVVSRDD
jgi:hypothetical protein